PFAPDYWPAGTTGISWFDVPIDADVSSGPISLIVGVYDRDTMNRLPVLDGTGKSAGNQLTLGPIKAHGLPQSDVSIAGPRLVRFADQIDLAGANVSKSSVSPGGQVTLTLEWRGRGRPVRDYTVFVHVLDADSSIVAQGDAPPRAGKYPT